MAMKLTTPSTKEVVTLKEAKDHLRITHTDEDLYIATQLIPSARGVVVDLTSRALVQETWTLTLARFQGDGPDGGIIILPHPPLVSVTSVKYVDQDGATQTWATDQYTVTSPTGPTALHAWIEPAFNISYPNTRNVPEAVTVLYDAGYGANAVDVPLRIKQAMLMVIEDLYGFRGSNVASARGMVAAPYLTPARLLGPFDARREDIRTE